MRTNHRGIPIQRSNNGRIRSAFQFPPFVDGVPTALFATVNRIATPRAYRMKYRPGRVCAYVRIRIRISNISLRGASLVSVDGNPSRERARLPSSVLYVELSRHFHRCRFARSRRRLFNARVRPGDVPHSRAN